MISSIRSEMSACPLRPAPAAPSWRRAPPPTCASSAARVTSAIVVPRRCASWRRRASRSSGSLTVVRFTGCQHTMHGAQPRGCQALHRSHHDQDDRGQERESGGRPAQVSGRIGRRLLPTSTLPRACRRGKRRPLVEGEVGQLRGQRKQAGRKRAGAQARQAKAGTPSRRSPSRTTRPIRWGSAFAPGAWASASSPI